MGKGATNTLARVSASLGLLNGVKPEFQLSLDVPNGGALFAIPALLASGLLKNISNHFELPQGYYSIENIFILLGMMALARVKSIENLRYFSPGEWGKLIGLDRIPEVKTLRSKLKILMAQHQPKGWSAELCKYWMSYDENNFAFYIDGHVRVYHGHQTKLPKHYVAREKLCLRATVDYWVNANNGEPFLLVNKSVDPGMIKTIEQDILPSIKASLPEHVVNQELNEHQHRFTLIFDREGYSPDFLSRMKSKKVACITYHKFPKEKWHINEFAEKEVCLTSGEQTAIRLAERGTKLNNGLWVREIRKLSNKGHQTSIISTDYSSDLKKVATRMFDRWSQENFFKYMRRHYNVDSLITYEIEPINEPIMVVNPAYREINNKIKSKNACLSKLLVKFGELSLIDEIEPEKVDAYQKQKAFLQEEIEQTKREAAELKKDNKERDRHIPIADLPENEKFDQLKSQSKHFIDTIKMIAYRAETAISNILREHLSRKDDARSLARTIFTTEADITPAENTITIQLHNLANDFSDRAVEKLCEELNATETFFPGTDLKFIYKMVS